MPVTHLRIDTSIVSSDPSSSRGGLRAPRTPRTPSSARSASGSGRLLRSPSSTSVSSTLSMTSRAPSSSSHLSIGSANPTTPISATSNHSGAWPTIDSGSEDESADAGQFVLAMHDFAPQQPNANCLSFRAGQVIRVLNRDASGWWDGQLDGGRRGWFPSNYVTSEVGLLTEEELPGGKVSAWLLSFPRLPFSSPFPCGWGDVRRAACAGGGVFQAGIPMVRVQAALARAAPALITLLGHDGSVARVRDAHALTRSAFLRGSLLLPLPGRKSSTSVMFWESSAGVIELLPRASRAPPWEREARKILLSLSRGRTHWASRPCTAHLSPDTACVLGVFWLVYNFLPLHTFHVEVASCMLSDLACMLYRAEMPFTTRSSGTVPF